jgi:hypothetical protein
MWGLQRPSRAFEEAKTALELVYDDTLEDARVKLSRRHDYHDGHRQWNAPAEPVYPYYLCGIEAFTDENGIVIDTIAGLTYHQTTEPRWSFVCGWVAFDWSSRDKAAIHELGHQLADLTHLCLDENTMSPLHDAEDCVMGQRDTAVCTGECLTTWPQFCPACRAELAQVR